MRKGLGRTIAVAATAALAASGTAAIAGQGGDSGRGGNGGLHRSPDFATVKYPSGRTLVLFDRYIRKDVEIRGLGSGERVVGIDVRPADGKLYAVSSANRVFTIDRSNGRIGYPQPLTDAVSGAAVTLNGNFYGVDFNPSVDRLRIVSDGEQNLRVNVDTGMTSTDAALQYPAGDRNAGQDPAVGAVGYTFAALGGPTALYDVDSARDTFTLQNPPNAGTLNSIGPVGFDVTAQGGFDIGGRERFRALGLYQQGGVARLYEHRFDQNGLARPTGLALRGQFDGFAVLGTDGDDY